MKKINVLLLIIGFACCICTNAFCVHSTSFASTTTQSESLFSTKNKPLFYGATNITIDKNIVSSFDILDSRFRIFAKDFEDGDLSSKIECVSNNVNPTIAGEYSIRYKVADSHNNTTDITVPVKVLNEENGVCTIERTLYTLPNVDNLRAIGVNRCHTGDRQILGVFMPAGSEIKVKATTTDINLDLQMLSNYNNKISFANLKKDNTDFATIKNVATDGECDSVPFATSVVQSKGVEINKTYKIIVSYNKSVLPLDYYLYKDDESKFFENWQASQNSLGVVDCEAMTVLVPLIDKDKISKLVAPNNNALIGNLDDSLAYFIKVTNKMDEMIGLSLNPNKATDQNVKVKYFAKSNGNASGNAYYAGNHIGVCGASIAAIFSYGWGTLHEIGHGYQGYLGQGSGAGFNMCLNETGNNILAHYVQIDKSIYKASGDWMGTKQNIEESRNNTRKSGKQIFNNAEGTYTNVGEKLYCLVNLFDAFEGSTTYAKLFSFYRSFVEANGTNKNNVPEIYAKFFAQTYNANIIPYLTAWGLPIGDGVKQEIYAKNLNSFSILKDSVTDEKLTEIKQGENLDLNYAPVDENLFEKYKVESNLNVAIEIDDFNKIANKNMAIVRNGKTIRIVKITSKNLKITNLTAGNIWLKFPTNFDYSTKTCCVGLAEGENNVTYTYKNFDYSFYHPSKIWIHGYFKTAGYVLTLSENNLKATIVYGGSNLGNQSDYWKNNPDEVFCSVTIFNADKTQEIDKAEVKGNQYFSNLTRENAEVELQYGYKIVIYTNAPQYVDVDSVLTGKTIAAYKTTNKTIEFEVCEQGLKLINVADFDTETVMYDAAVDNLKQTISNYLEGKTLLDLANRNSDTETKQNIVKAYKNLKPADRQEFDESVAAILKGSAPQIKAKQGKVEIFEKEQIDLLSLIEITDDEDFEIEPTAENVNIDTNLNTNQKGEYIVKYIVVDSDGNTSSLELTIKVKHKINKKEILITTIFVLSTCAILGLGVCVAKLKQRKIK